MKIHTHKRTKVGLEELLVSWMQQPHSVVEHKRKNLVLAPTQGKYFGIRGFKHPHSETQSGTLEAQACYVEAPLPEKYFRSTATTL